MDRVGPVNVGERDVGWAVFEFLFEEGGDVEVVYFYTLLVLVTCWGGGSREETYS